MRKIAPFFIVGILSIVFAYQKRKELFAITPNVEVLASDSSLIMQQGVLHYHAKPFSGFVLEKYNNGQLATKNVYLEGLLEGKQEKWYPDGSKMEVRFYKKNRKTGKHNGWWENHQMKFEYFIKDDVPIATHREWYPNGQLYWLANFDSEGQPEGTQQMWFQTGQVKSNYVIKNGRRFGFLGAKGCMGEREKKQSGMSFSEK